jgi:hypothetical protein
MKSHKVINLFVVVLLLLVSAGTPLMRAVSAPLAGTDAPELTTMPAPIVKFPGLARPLADTDPDNIVPETSGAAGISQYMQAVNKTVALFSKDGTFPGQPLGTPQFSATFEQFWAGANTATACDGGEQTSHHGQPSVIFDHKNSRWVVLDVAYVDVDNGPYYICVAVSNGTPTPVPAAPADPTYFTPAYWFYYAFDTAEGIYRYLPDSPKLGLWQDGYYLAVDLFDVYNGGMNRIPKGAKVWALNRAVLANPTIAGTRYVSFWLNEHMGFEHLVPSNMLGNPPANGTPNLFAAIQPGKLHFWNFKVDWIDPSRSTFGTAIQNPNFTMNTDTTPIWANGYLATQPVTSEQLDVHGERMTSPLQFRIVDGFPSIWGTHAVLSNGVTGLRWYEFRQSQDGTPFIYQQGTYQPDARFRWLSSLSIDRVGDMAIGYSESKGGTDSMAKYPSIRYTGRLKNDPLGQLITGEAILKDGLTYYDNGNGVADGPWGRQSSMTVDPVDECIFWYTNEHFDVSNTQWQTYIGWFSFPNCKGGSTERVSLHTQGTQGNLSSGVDFEMYSVAGSVDGRYVAFSSEATNLVNNDTNNYRDIFLRDRDTDVDGIFDEPGAVSTVRVMGLNGQQPNGDSWDVSISADGRYLAFASEATNLVPTDYNTWKDVFVYDRTNTLVTRASMPDRSIREPDAESDQPFVINQGGVIWVAFRSYATNLVASSVRKNLGTNIYLRTINSWTNDLNNYTNLVSVPNPALPLVIANAFSPTLSDGAATVAYASDAPNLVAGDTNAVMDVFVYYRSIGTTERVSVSSAPANAQGNNDSYTPYISGDGQFVVFASRANNLVAVDTNLVADIFIRDLVLDLTSLVSVSFFGTQANGNSYSPSISWDGNYIAFASEASNLDVSLRDLNASRDIFLHDRSMVNEGIYANGLTSRISLDYLGGEPNDWSFAPVVTANGRQVIYVSEATDLVNGDTNSVWDVFAYDSQRVVPTFLSIPGNISGAPGQVVRVPVWFTSTGQTIDTTAFSIDFDQVCLSFDPADADANGLPDAVIFNVPVDFTRTATYNAGDTDGEIDISIYDQVAPRATLQNGILLSIDFTVRSTCQAAPGSSNSARVGFSKDPTPSFASLGQSIPGAATDGFIRILEGKYGDCNGDGNVDAADITSFVLEIFDGDNSDPAQTPGGTFKGNPIGCNPNQDFVVDAGDLSCTILIIQAQGTGTPAACVGGSGTGSASFASFLATTSRAASSSISLSLPNYVVGLAGKTVQLPVNLRSNGNLISSMAFSVDFDESMLSFDPSDSNSDGLPDAIVLNLPAGFFGSASFDAADVDGELDVIIFNPTVSSVGLQDGAIATITLSIGSTPDPILVPVDASHDPWASFGSPSGLSLPGFMDDGSVWVTNRLFRIYIASVNQ